ncbi:hypothetical protein LWI29_029214 [Acer saccharum]|uniref:Uncharacterized protein n=1 Tax=Acer saccharum TaxID=4024 RepID=A0AA39RXW1_ACESA|nr:hypothetical protein LWI29_029214 [Acer saccharum]
MAEFYLGFGISEYELVKEFFANYENLSRGYVDIDVPRPERVKALRGPADGRWEGNSKLKLKQSQPLRIPATELPQWLGFWNVFHTFSLTPVLYMTTISKHRADIFYSYVVGMRIDIGQVILGAILNAGGISLQRGPKPKPIIFPTLITALLKKKGVVELSSDELRSNTMGDLNLKSWNDVTSNTKGRKIKRTVRGQSNAARSDLEVKFDFKGVEPESDEEDVDYKADSGRSKLDQILDAVQLLYIMMDFFEAEMRD